MKNRKIELRTNRMGQNAQNSITNPMGLVPDPEKKTTTHRKLYINSRYTAPAAVMLIRPEMKIYKTYKIYT